MSNSQSKEQTPRESRVAEACATLDMFNGQQRVKPPIETERADPKVTERQSKTEGSRPAGSATGSREALLHEQLKNLTEVSTDLHRGSANDVKTLVADVILPQLKRLETSFIDALRYYLVGVYAVGRAINHGGGGSGRQSALQAFGVESGEKIYLSILNRVHELPTEAVARKRMQGRFSDYQVALAEAARQNLGTDALLLRLKEDGGIAALVKTARALKPEKEPSRGGRRAKARVGGRPRRGNAYATGSKSAAEAEPENGGGKSKADEDDWGTAQPATLHSDDSKTSRQVKPLPARRSGESIRRLVDGPSTPDGNLVVGRKARNTFTSGDAGAYAGRFALKPGNPPTLILYNLSSFPDHEYNTDQEAFEAMIRSLRRDRSEW